MTQILLPGYSKKISCIFSQCKAGCAIDLAVRLQIEGKPVKSYAWRYLYSIQFVALDVWKNERKDRVVKSNYRGEGSHSSTLLFDMGRKAGLLRYW